MKNLFLLSVMLVAPSMSAFAAEGDLVLQNEKWLAKFDKYVCAAFGPAVARPSALEDFNVVFVNLGTDSTLDNGIIRATLTENGKACSYSALVLADNDAATMKLVQSKAFALSDQSECVEGKKVIDSALASNNYLYYGHPHNLAIMAPVSGAKAACGTDLVGINFVVVGKVPGAALR